MLKPLACKEPKKYFRKNPQKNNIPANPVIKEIFIVANYVWCMYSMSVA